MNAGLGRRMRAPPSTQDRTRLLKNGSPAPDLTAAGKKEPPSQGNGMPSSPGECTSRASTPQWAHPLAQRLRRGWECSPVANAAEVTSPCIPSSHQLLIKSKSVNNGLDHGSAISVRWICNKYQENIDDSDSIAFSSTLISVPLGILPAIK